MKCKTDEEAANYVPPPELSTFGFNSDRSLQNLLAYSKKNSETFEFSTNRMPAMLTSDINKIFLNDHGIQVNYTKKFGSERAIFDKGHQKINTIMSLSFKTDNKMNGWNEKVQLERIEKMDEFVAIAQQISFLLIEDGYFCDFIDPTTGRPWFSNKENSENLQVLETNDNFDGLGNIEIQDMGCCRVLSHKEFGLNCFVGTIVSNCPEDYDILKKLEGVRV